MQRNGLPIDRPGFFQQADPVSKLGGEPTSDTLGRQ